MLWAVLGQQVASIGKGASLFECFGEGTHQEGSAILMRFPFVSFSHISSLPETYFLSHERGAPFELLFLVCLLSLYQDNPANSFGGSRRFFALLTADAMLTSQFAGAAANARVPASLAESGLAGEAELR